MPASDQIGNPANTAVSTEGRTFSSLARLGDIGLPSVLARGRPPHADSTRLSAVSSSTSPEVRERDLLPDPAAALLPRPLRRASIPEPISASEASVDESLMVMLWILLMDASSASVPLHEHARPH